MAHPAGGPASPTVSGPPPVSPDAPAPAPPETRPSRQPADDPQAHGSVPAGAGPPTLGPESGSADGTRPQASGPGPAPGPPDAPSTAGNPDRRPGSGSRLITALRSTHAGRLGLRIAVALAGAVVIALGVLLIPLPGPGWVIVLAGLAIWSIEFTWAERLLHFTRRQLSRWWHWIAQRSLFVRIALGTASLVLVGAVVWVSVRLSFGVDLVAVCWNFITTR